MFSCPGHAVPLTTFWSLLLCMFRYSPQILSIVLNPGFIVSGCHNNMTFLFFFVYCLYITDFLLEIIASLSFCRPVLFFYRGEGEEPILSHQELGFPSTDSSSVIARMRVVSERL